jgi:hypothetical protein
MLCLVSKYIVPLCEKFAFQIEPGWTFVTWRPVWFSPCSRLWSHLPPPGSPLLPSLPVRPGQLLPTVWPRHRSPPCHPRCYPDPLWEDLLLDRHFKDPLIRLLHYLLNQKMWVWVIMLSLCNQFKDCAYYGMALSVCLDLVGWIDTES